MEMLHSEAIAGSEVEGSASKGAGPFLLLPPKHEPFQADMPVTKAIIERARRGETKPASLHFGNVQRFADHQGAGEDEQQG